jgi:hypothetical protein
MLGAGSSCAAKNEQPMAAIIGADAPSVQPVAIQNAEVIRTTTAAPAADHSASPWSRCRAIAVSGRQASCRRETSSPATMARLSARQSLEMSTSSRNRINRFAVVI